MLKIVKEVNDRLNLENELIADDIIIMYTTCAFETAWNKNSKSPWCTPFTVDDLKVIEYSEDLKYYWQDGYGHELSYKQACPAFGDMISFLESKDSFPKTNVYFTHSGTLLKILAHLGLYKEDQHLTAKNYDKMKSRKWRTSVIDSFATNLAFVLFNCGGEKKVLTMHQENVVRLPSCPDYDLCEIKKITNHYSHSIKSCDFNSLCSV
ncbi:hypothetical protein NQ314_015388 [Rhamnusium bicolor]|uniref:Multiple inositol polyphosphate phosphatase 1 n=1 Tax=Rhamnusium bicolor TaxID=1586634 RepID=A0AAV8WZF8_9CUCU|nr:hypothetical protein NQ314_015388 [Rhamnusium bicolor]